MGRGVGSRVGAGAAHEARAALLRRVLAVLGLTRARAARQPFSSMEGALGGLH